MAAWVCAAMLLGCGGEERSDATNATASGAPTNRPTDASSAAPAPSALQSAAGASSSGTPTTAGANPFVGTWKGSYRAEKVSPTLDPTVKDEVWKDDDGKRHAGAGRIELTVAPDGTTTGSIDGALGPSDLQGTADDRLVRATVAPRGEDGAGGTLIGKSGDKGLVVELRTSDGAGKVPRVARATLEKAP